MRRALLALLAIAVSLAVVAPAQGRTVSTERAQREIDRSRVVLGESLEALKAGDRDRAYALSRDAYLNHFEFVEIPLRLRNPNLVLDTEFKYGILKLGKQLPLKPMLAGGAAVLLLLSVAFVGNAVRSLQEADYLAATPVSWPRLPVFPAELTGIHPTTQGLIIQGALLAVYVLGALRIFALQPSRRRRASGVAAA
jgi:hypothetical protein